MDLVSKIKEHEGLCLYAYNDSLGYITVGYGRCLDRRKGKGITQAEAQFLLENDINECRGHLAHFIWFTDLDTIRQDVLVELCFNIGLTGVLEFKNMLSLLAQHNYKGAAADLLDSLWCKQVGPTRSQDMAHRLATGSYV